MPTTVSLEGTKKVVFFPFHGKNWGLKLLVGSALSLANYIIPFVPLIPLYGYAGQVAKRVIVEGEDPELPDWNDWGLYFTDGIKLFGVSIIFMIPALVLMFGGYLVMFGMNFAFMFDPNFYRSADSVTPFIFSSMAGAFIGMGIMMIGMLLGLVTSLFLPPALGHLIAKGQFSAAFRVREWWPIFKSNFGGYLLMLALLYGISMGLVWISYIFYFTVVLCFLMPFALAVVTFLLSVIHFSLIAVTYRDGIQTIAQTN